MERRPRVSQPARITTPFDKSTTAAEIIAGLNLTGRRAVVTGASSGPGRKAMRDWPWRTVEQGAANSVLAAASPLLDGVGGRYFENCNEALPRDPGAAATDVDNAGVARYAIDPDIAARLWHVSTAMLRDAGWID